MIISHDRWFLSRVCTHMLSFPDTGATDRTPRFFEGGYDDFIRSAAKEGPGPEQKRRRTKKRRKRKRKRKSSSSSR